MNNQKMKLMNDTPRKTALLQICKRRKTKLRSWTDCCSDDHVPSRFKQIRMQRITFGDKLADTQPWIAEAFKYARASS